MLNTDTDTEEVTNGIDSFVSNCEFIEEVSEVDTDILSDKKEINSSEEESSTQLCSLCSGQRRNVRSFQRHPSVDEWLLGLSINTTPVQEHKKEVEAVTHNIDEDKLNGRGLHNDEAVFQAYDVKETVSKKSVYDSSEKGDIQARNEIAESLSKTIFSSQNNKEEDDDDEDDGVENDEEEDADEKSVMESIFLNYEEKPPSSKMENLKTLFVSNCLVEEQHKEVSPSFFMSCEQESEAEKIIDLKNSEAPEIRESIEMCGLTNIYEKRINLGESDACTYINKIENTNFQESKFENVESTDCTEAQQSNLENTTDMLHDNSESTLPLTLISFENISSNYEILKSVENDEKESPCVFSDIEIVKPINRRSKSLKTCRTPPGNPSCPKLVRFADILGLDLSETRVFADEIPKVPKAAFVDLDVKHIDNYTASNKPNILPKSLIPRPKHLVPIFPQPGSLVQFHDLVQLHKVCLESAQMTGLTTLTGDVRVLNISFNKNISVLWTVDHWVTKMYTMCEYVPGSSDGITDKFRFHLETAGLAEGSRVHLCIRYETGEQEYWDNNGGENYVFRVGQKTEDQSLLEEDFLT